MLTPDQVYTIKKILSPFTSEYIGVFGSYARGEQNKSSDLDLLVKFTKELTLFALVGLEQELSETLKIKVDLVQKLP